MKAKKKREKKEQEKMRTKKRTACQPKKIMPLKMIMSIENLYF